MRLSKILALLLVAGPLFAGSSSDPAEMEKNARADLAKKLFKLSQSLDMKESKYEESAGQGKSFDNDTGNPFMSNTTIHYSVESTCREWVASGTLCNEWLDPYISEHGFGADYSPLEGLVAREWMAKKGVDGGGKYRIWDIQRGSGSSGSNLDQDGKLDRSGIVSWKLSDDVRKKVEDLGEQTAVRQMALTFDDDAPKRGVQDNKNVMPNIESMRMMASRWTKMFRNRLVANLADMRVADKPTEFLLNEDTPDCESYVNAMQTRQEQTKAQLRFEEQASLQPETINQDLQQRYQACKALRAASVKMVNAEANGGQVQAGDPNSERLDKWRTRLNIALIDGVGIDPNSVPRPQNAPLPVRDLASESAEWNEGGTKIVRKKMITNRGSLQSYNNDLELAAVGMEDVLARVPDMTDTTSQIRSHKIKPGQYNAVRLNSLTITMRDDMKGTVMTKSGVMKGTETKLEDNATQLAVTKR
ncbi:hypothetical protein K2X33_07745 [bacterium]|nr:hypothetical protein [bacterium]